MDRETDRLFAEARDRQREEPREPGDEPQPTSGSEAAESDASVDLGDGGSPIRRGAHERAWRVKGGPWQRESNGRKLLVSVIRYLASIDVRGRQRFYDEAAFPQGKPLFSDSEERSSSWRRVESDIDKVVNIRHSSHPGIEAFLAQACAQCKTSTGAPIRLGEDIVLVLDLSSG